MSEVISFSPSAMSVRLNVIFVHGLGGGGRSTWKVGDDQFFPAWIADADDGLGVYSVDYDASPTKWLSSGMPLTDRANELIETLRVHGIFTKPTVFIAHSMGGLLVKKMLQLVVTQKLADWSGIESSIKGVLFLSTPHAGANMATYLKALSKVLPLRPTEVVLDLQKNSAHLRELAGWFRNHYPTSHLRSRVYFEKYNTMGVRVVDETSADPGVSSVVVTPIDADHFQMAAPKPNTLVHKGVLEFVQSVARTIPRVPLPRRPLQEAKDSLDPTEQSIVGVLDDSPHLQSWAIEVIKAKQYPTMMSLCSKEHLVPNPAWEAPDLDDAAKELPLANCLRGHMFLSVVRLPGKHPHLKCYFAKHWGNLIPFYKHPTDRGDYLEAVRQFARDYYQGEALPTGKAVISVKRNEQFRRQLWLYCFELYSLVLPQHYRASEDDNWFDLERLSDESYPEAHVNGDIIRALREYFGTDFHEIIPSQIDSTEVKIGDS